MSKKNNLSSNNINTQNEDLNKNKNILTLSQACEVLSISEATIKNWIKTHKIFNFQKKGRGYFFSLKDIDEIKKLIENDDSLLKKRRNKQQIKGNFTYSDYINPLSLNYQPINNLVNTVNNEEIKISDDLLKLILSDIFIKLFKDRISNINQDVLSSEKYSNTIYSFDILSGFENSNLKTLDFFKNFLLSKQYSLCSINETLLNKVIELYTKDNSRANKNSNFDFDKLTKQFQTYYKTEASTVICNNNSSTNFLYYYTCIEQLILEFLLDDEVTLNRIIDISLKEISKLNEVNSNNIEEDFTKIIQSINTKITVVIKNKIELLLDIIKANSSLLESIVSYNQQEDLLGLFYISLKNIGARKASGSYYTPITVVKTLIENLFANKTSKELENVKLLDPCCGCGNFLLFLPETIKLNNIHAQDLDSISVYLTRCNLFLKYCNIVEIVNKNDDIVKKGFKKNSLKNDNTLSLIELLHTNIIQKDYLDEYDSHFYYQEKNNKYKISIKNDYINNKSSNKQSSSYQSSIMYYDYVIGNPPWGSVFSTSQKKDFNSRYICSTTTAESFSLFIEKSLVTLKKNGILSFVLPEAFLTTKTHKLIREIILSNTSFKYINYLGDNIFSKVQCPSIIMTTELTYDTCKTKGLIVKKGDEIIHINTDRHLTSDCINLMLTNEEHKILHKLLVENQKNLTQTSLKDNSLFALGIVTGNNDTHITFKKNDLNEIVLKGQDIVQYSFSHSNNYLVFEGNSFQQVAPVHMYRAPEKLLYRFISKKLIFAYDNKQTLSLNSCNILIPKIEGLAIKYILAILNSSVAQYIYSKYFGALKVLREHIEFLPIPIVDDKTQLHIINLVDEILEFSKNVDLKKLTDEEKQQYENMKNTIDQFVCTKLFNLTDEEYQIVKNNS